MKQAKHTPAPWVVGEKNRIKGADTTTVCDVSGWANKTPFDGKSTIRGQGERDANARLIAAAPELLEALKDLINCSLDLTAERRQIERYAREVIAKATGES